MIPAAAIVNNPAPAQPSLVATPLAGNFAQHVAPSNVPPSVSSVQINNNARGNGSYTPVTQIAQLAVPVVDGDAMTGAIDGMASSKIPATFLAQMIGQEVPPALQGTLSNVLAAYDQLVANSFVKYKPSNATVPAPAPAGVFGRILAQDQPAPQPARVEAPPPQPVQVQQSQAPQATPPQVPVQAVQPVQREVRQNAPAERPATQQATPKRTAVKVAISYLMTEALPDRTADSTVTATA